MTQVFLLPSDVSGQDQGADLILEPRLHVMHLVQETTLDEAADCGPPVMILQDRSVLEVMLSLIKGKVVIWLGELLFLINEDTI